MKQSGSRPLLWCHLRVPPFPLLCQPSQTKLTLGFPDKTIAGNIYYTWTSEEVGPATRALARFAPNGHGPSASAPPPPTHTNTHVHTVRPVGNTKLIDHAVVELATALQVVSCWPTTRLPRARRMG